MKNGGWKLLSTATVVIQVGARGRGLYSSMIKKSLHLLLAKGCGRGRTLLAGGHVIIGDQDVVGERTQYNVCRLTCTLDRSWSRERALYSFLSICSMFIYSGWYYICIYLLYNVCYVMKDLNLILKKIDQDNCWVHVFMYKKENQLCILFLIQFNEISRRSFWILSHGIVQASCSKPK